MTDLQELKRLALAATPGPWQSAYAGCGTKAGFKVTEYFVRRPGDDFAIAADIVDPDMEPSSANADYIAASDPQTILALIDRVERAERAQVPIGWRAVPIEPTDDMVIGGFESTPDRVFVGDKYPEEYEYMTGCQQAAFRAKRCYAAMIKSAPAAPKGE